VRPVTDLSRLDPMETAHAAIRRAALQAAPAGRAEEALGRAVFEAFPDGLLVFAGDRRLIAANPASERLLAPLGAAAIGTPCCALLGCRDEAGPLRELCLSERALEEGRPLPDVRLEFTVDAQPRAVWVATAPLDRDRVLVQLRPGRLGDRRRRTEPHWTAGPSLRVRTLGRTRVLAPEGPLEGAWLRQRPGQLLKLLVCNRHRITHTDEIAVAFWPESDRTGLQNVRHFVHALRSQLEPERAPRARSSFIIAHEGGYELDASRVVVDADEFEAHAHAGLRALQRSEVDRARESLGRAAALYDGEFLADEPYAEWTHAERGHLHELASRTFSGLAEIALEAGAAETATGHLYRLARLEPLDSHVQRRLLRLLLARGRSGEAQRHYRSAHAAWLAALGEKPDFDLASLRREARSGTSATA
jgi:DNA-binding SARP family transcriptional activator/PAS domain-containing protein